MKKPAALVREIEANQAKLALLQKEHARIGQEISELAVVNKARILELVGTTVESLDLGQVPIHLLVSKLSQLGEGLVHGDPVSQDKTAVFVKFGRNASSANRQVLLSAGLHWHGRDGGWVGRVTEAELAGLREAFGDRVSASKSEDADPALEELPNDAPDVVSADVAAIVPLAEDEEGQARPATREDRLASRLVPPSFAFPLRRPAET